MTPAQERDLVRQSREFYAHKMPHNGRQHSITTLAQLKARARRRKATAALRAWAGATWRAGR